MKLAGNNESEEVQTKTVEANMTLHQAKILEKRDEEKRALTVARQEALNTLQEVDLNSAKVEGKEWGLIEIIAEQNEIDYSKVQGWSYNTKEKKVRFIVGVEKPKPEELKSVEIKEEPVRAN